MAAFTAASVIPPNFTNIQNKKISNLAGSTGAQLYKNSTDTKWVVKSAKKGSGGFEQVKMEALANDIYEAVGIPVPKHKLDVAAKSLILEYIDGPTLKKINTDEMPGEESKGESKYEKAKAELQKGFIIDALIANWDVIGLDEDNIIVPSNGTPAVRIDNGGTFMFKATGGKKPFGKFVTEIHTMRSKKNAPEASKIFGSLTDTDIDEQIKTLIVPNRQTILDIVPLELKPVMEARLDYLIDKTVWTNATVAGENIKYNNYKYVIVEVPDAVEKVKKEIIKFFDHKDSKPTPTLEKQIIDYINTRLYNNKAIISGGFILKSLEQYADDKSVDIDIYVPQKNAQYLRDGMSVIFRPTKVVTHVQSSLQNSFFKKNGIYSVTKYSREKPTYAEMDIVAVMDDRDPRDVVVNFDLSFCKNWYESTKVNNEEVRSEKVYMVDKEGVYAKKGMLGNNYLNLLYAGNPVLINRLKKYINRGFQISINNPKTKQIEDITEGIKSGKLFQQPSNVINNSPHNSSRNVDLSDIKTSIEERRVSNKPYKINIDPKKGNNINVDANIVKPINSTTITQIDIEAIRYYTGDGYTNVNSFLYEEDYEPKPATRPWPILKYLEEKFPGNDSIKLLYYYFINLYNAVQKGPTANIIFKVYRGTKNWYLSIDSNKAYYMNSFTSTTTKFKTAMGFSSKSHSRVGPTKNIYVFYIHPLCRYMNVTSISVVKSEEEILLTPYHKYIYVDERDAGNGYILRKYIVLPTDIDIPSNYKEFMVWKNYTKYINSIALFSAAANGVASNGVAIPPVIPVQTKYINVSNILKPSNNIKVSNIVLEELSPKSGGRVPIYNSIVRNKLILQNNKRQNIMRNKTQKTHKKLNKKFVHIKSIKNKSKMNTTRKVKKSTKSYTKDYIERMTAPIPSFPAKPLSAIEKTIIDQMKAYIKKDKIIDSA